MNEILFVPSKIQVDAMVEAFTRHGVPTDPVKIRQRLAKAYTVARKVGARQALERIESELRLGK